MQHDKAKNFASQFIQRDSGDDIETRNDSKRHIDSEGKTGFITRLQSKMYDKEKNN